MATSSPPSHAPPGAAFGQGHKEPVAVGYALRLSYVLRTKWHCSYLSSYRSLGYCARTLTVETIPAANAERIGLLMRR